MSEDIERKERYKTRVGEFGGWKIDKQIILWVKEIAEAITEQQINMWTMKAHDKKEGDLIRKLGIHPPAQVAPAIKDAKGKGKRRTTSEPPGNDTNKLCSHLKKHGTCKGCKDPKECTGDKGSHNAKLYEKYKNE